MCEGQITKKPFPKPLRVHCLLACLLPDITHRYDNMLGKMSSIKKTARWRTIYHGLSQTDEAASAVQICAAVWRDQNVRVCTILRWPISMLQYHQLRIVRIGDLSICRNCQLRCKKWCSRLCFSPNKVFLPAMMKYSIGKSRRPNETPIQDQNSSLINRKKNQDVWSTMLWENGSKIKALSY